MIIPKDMDKWWLCEKNSVNSKTVIKFMKVKL